MSFGRVFLYRPVFMPLTSVPREDRKTSSR